ncbi:MAG: response regulator transcription factor [Dehalococcoidia bacterium]
MTVLNVMCIGLEPDVLEHVRLAMDYRWPGVHMETAGADRAAPRRTWDAQPDLVIIQQLPGHAEMATAISEVRSKTEAPLVVWGREGDEAEAVKTLEMGADDYIKPNCGLMELMARTVALLRRSRTRPLASSDLLASGSLRLKPRYERAFLGNDELKFTPTEFRLLHLLMSRRDSVVTRDLLRNALWEGRSGADSLIKKYVQRVRQKLQDDPREPKWIASVSTVGYRFVGPPAPASRHEAESGV